MENSFSIKKSKAVKVPKEIIDTGALNKQGEKILCSKQGDKRSYFVERQGPKRSYISKKTLLSMGLLSLEEPLEPRPSLVASQCGLTSTFNEDEQEIFGICGTNSKLVK